MNRQQCCSQVVLDFVNYALSTAINNETIISRFTASAFSTAQNAIDEMRDKTDGMELLYNILHKSINSTCSSYNFCDQILSLCIMNLLICICDRLQ